jgi:hypothetical protein
MTIENIRVDFDTVVTNIGVLVNQINQAEKSESSSVVTKIQNERYQSLEKYTNMLKKFTRTKIELLTTIDEQYERLEEIPESEENFIRRKKIEDYITGLEHIISGYN